MQFRSYSDLARTINLNLSRVPGDVDLIVGIPRSGLLPATVLALGLNLPVTDVDGLLDGRLVATGITRRTGGGISTVEECRHALVIDDSTLTGGTLAAIRQRIAEAKLPLKISYAAVYVTQESAGAVDYYFEICPRPRFFEWNYLHHHYLASSLMDLDGILGVDATKVNVLTSEQRQRYFAALEPRVRPSNHILGLTTCCTGAVLPELRVWLARQRIEFELMLAMEPTDSAASDTQYLDFKVQALRQEKRAVLFFDGTPGHARSLALRSRKPVIDVTEPRLHEAPSTLWVRLNKRAQRLPHHARVLLRRLTRSAPPSTPTPLPV